MKADDMKVTLLVITDGRGELLEQTLASEMLNLVRRSRPFESPFSGIVLVDDSADRGYAEWLDAKYPGFAIFHNGARQGFAGAIQSGWHAINLIEALPHRGGYRPDYIFHLEDDFLFNDSIDLDAIIEVMEANPRIAQMCLRRQPWGTEPKEGGFIAQWPERYNDCEMNGAHWLEHRNFFSTNPSLYPRRIIDYGWPDAPDSEGKFGPKLWADDYVAAFWGKRGDPPRVHHIGNERVGNGY